MRVIAAALRGVAAGAVATVAMDLVWYRRHRAAGGEAGFVDWELSGAVDGFGDGAPAPARVGKRIADAVGVDLPPSAAAATNNVVHWLTGVGWGQLAGVAAGILPIPRLTTGLAAGVTAWGTSYPVLGKLGIYEPITHYDAATLGKDLSAHLVFGATLGVVLALLGTGAKLRT